MNKNKGVIGLGLILAIVLGIVVVGGGAYYLVTKEKEPTVSMTWQNRYNKSKEEKILLKKEVSSLEGLNKIINNKFPELAKSWEEKGFNVLMFKKENEYSIAKEEYPYNPSENKIRESIYIYSPDETKILDPKGSVELFEKDGKIEEAYDVDSSVKLIDLKTNKWKQVASCGTPCGFNGAVWLDHNIFIVTGLYHGFTKNECLIYEECTKATLYVYDLLDDTVTFYIGPAIEYKSQESSSAPVKNSTTYTYKNHGFTIELPKGYIPKEEQAEGGPAIMIKFPNNSGLNYITNATFWEKSNIPQYKYTKEEKVGETIFKVYSYGNATLYYFKQGNIAYEFYGDKELLKTFRFVGWN